MMEKDEDLGPEQKQFFALSERCQQMFHGLRDLGLFLSCFFFENSHLFLLGSFGRGYQPYFQKTFEVYTRLWKFQQNYRGPLEAAGLKRWEIGDIASHIGQIYYHYYLRTSDRSYLAESSVFYEAIQQRKYFQELTSSSLTEDWRRLLRYYARYIVVCLLQQRFEQVSAVSTNLHKYVQQYINMLSPPDAQEWLAGSILTLIGFSCLSFASGSGVEGIFPCVSASVSVLYNNSGRLCGTFSNL